MEGQYIKSPDILQYKEFHLSVMQLRIRQAAGIYMLTVRDTSSYNTPDFKDRG